MSTVCGQQPPRSGDITARIAVRTIDSVAAVAPRQWDALVGPDNFYNSHRWLRALELAHGDTAVVTVSGDGRLLGALPTWPGERDAPLFRLPDLFPELTGSWPDGYLWLGARRSVYNELLCVRGPLRTPTLTALMRGALATARSRGALATARSRGALATARSRGAAGLVLPYLTGRDAAELARTHPRARVLLHDADANLPVPDGGFAAHLARMRHGDRTRRRAELRACERAGTAVRWLPLTEETIPVAADLITQNRARYGGTADPGWIRRSFAAQHRSGVLGQAVGCFGFRDGRPVAVTVCYTHHDRLYARYFGFDYRRAQPAGEYFVLSYYAPLDYAAARGLPHLRLAVSAWRHKTRRGAVLSPLAAVVLPLGHEVCTPERAAVFNHATARRWRARCATRPQALAPEWDHWESIRPTDRPLDGSGEDNPPWQEAT
ncbi:GNAT family N-acetyltransferase [Streptomyces sp. NPDC046203]|uniref:peptidogalycan biosysnthesis protein n=1 Tax=Streptomyces sp. NPDC046203 TaxID=3154602 RepID=UPI0033D2A637